MASCKSKDDAQLFLSLVGQPQAEVFTPEPEIPATPPKPTPIPESPYKKGWVYLIDKNEKIIYKAEIDPWNVNAYRGQADMMNQMDDPLCPCSVVVML